jgi:hypothetical protein
MPEPPGSHIVRRGPRIGSPEGVRLKLAGLELDHERIVRRHAGIFETRRRRTRREHNCERRDRTRVQTPVRHRSLLAGGHGRWRAMGPLQRNFTASPVRDGRTTVREPVQGAETSGPTGAAVDVLRSRTDGRAEPKRGYLCDQVRACLPRQKHYLPIPYRPAPEHVSPTPFCSLGALTAACGTGPGTPSTLRTLWVLVPRVVSPYTNPYRARARGARLKEPEPSCCSPGGAGSQGAEGMGAQGGSVP